MKTKIRSMKQELKEMALKIRTLKVKRKEPSNYSGYVPGLSSAQEKYRINHITYCLLRGRKPEEIENKHRDPENYYHKWVWKQARDLVDQINKEYSGELSDETVCSNS